MHKKTVEKRNIAQVFEDARATISIGMGDGYAAISLVENGKHTIQFYNDEGWPSEDMTHETKDIENLANFIKDLNSLKLEDYKI